MRDAENKEIMAKNIRRYMERKGVTNQQLCADLDFKYTTFLDWINAVTYPRMGKIEAMANYFGIQKSDLIEEALTEEKEKDNDVLSDIIVRMRTDKDFKSAVEYIYMLDASKVKGVGEMLRAFTQ